MTVPALYQPTHGTTRRGRPRLNYVDYIERLTGMKTNELLDVSQDREAWRERVVACVDLQSPPPPDWRERERERERKIYLSVSNEQAYVDLLTRRPTSV